MENNFIIMKIAYKKNKQKNLHNSELHKSHITSPENCLFCVLYVSFNAFQIISLARNKNDIPYVHRNELFYVDNPEDGCKLVLRKYSQPLASVYDVISGKPVISSAPL
jgi:hypothetical protein